MTTAGRALDAMAAEVIATARGCGLTLGVAESLTGGAVCSALVAIPGASAVLRGGVVAYATDVKHSVLGVDARLLAERGAVDPDVAVAMAAAVRRLTGADLGVSTTGVAGPDPQDGNPAGVVYVAVAGATGPRVRRLLVPGDRAAVRQAAVEAALGAVLEALTA